MPKMGKFPPFGKRFFRRARKLLGSCHFEHLWRIVIALASLEQGRSLSKFEDAGNERRSRQAISNFLTTADWNAPELLQQTAVDQLLRLGFQPGDTLYLLLDDTQKRKRGKLMAAVSKIFLHAGKVYANGHTILGAALLYRNVVLPCAAKLWASRESCRQSRTEPDAIDRLDFRTLTGMAADVVAGLQLPDGARPIVLFDSYYLCLVLIAHLLLTHLALDAPDAKAKLQTRADLRLPSIPHLQHDLRRQLWNQVLDGLAKNKTTRRAAKKLREAIQL